MDFGVASVRAPVGLRLRRGNGRRCTSEWKWGFLLYFAGTYDRVAPNALMITVLVGQISAQVVIGVIRRITDTSLRRRLVIRRG